MESMLVKIIIVSDTGYYLILSIFLSLVSCSYVIDLNNFAEVTAKTGSWL